MVYTLAKYNGTPIRHGKYGYNQNSFVRIAVRETKQFDDFMDCISILPKINKISHIHINIDSDIIVGFMWLESESLLKHEEYIESRCNLLVNYIETIDTGKCIPAIIICSRTFLIIDGHHRFGALKKLGLKKMPCLLINYSHPNIIVNPYNKSISKEQVLNASKNNLPPKSTCHHLIDNNTNTHPIQVLSPIVQITQN